VHEGQHIRRASAERTAQGPQLKGLNQGPAYEMAANLSHSSAAIENQQLRPTGA